MMPCVLQVSDCQESDVFATIPSAVWIIAVRDVGGMTVLVAFGCTVRVRRGRCGFAFLSRGKTAVPRVRRRDGCRHSSVRGLRSGPYCRMAV